MKRYSVGVLKGVHAEPGTILGPNVLGEHLVVIEQVDGGVSVGYAQKGDVEEAARQPEPRSVTEARLRTLSRKLRR